VKNRLQPRRSAKKNLLLYCMSGRKAQECVPPFRRVAARIASIDSQVTLSTFSFYLVSFQIVEPEY
jgi:hypothetical protein